MCSLSPEGGWACLVTPDNWTWYCIHISDSGGGGGNQPPPTPHMEWIADSWNVPGCSWRMNYWSCSLDTGGSYLVLQKTIMQRGFPFENMRDITFSLTGQFNWARGMARVEVTINTVHWGHQSIRDTVMEKKMNARGPGHPWRSGKAIFFCWCLLSRWLDVRLGWGSIWWGNEKDQWLPCLMHHWTG